MSYTGSGGPPCQRSSRFCAVPRLLHPEGSCNSGYGTHSPQLGHPPEPVRLYPHLKQTLASSASRLMIFFMSPTPYGIGLPQIGQPLPRGPLDPHTMQISPTTISNRLILAFMIHPPCRKGCRPTTFVASPGLEPGNPLGFQPSALPTELTGQVTVTTLAAPRKPWFTISHRYQPRVSPASRPGSHPWFVSKHQRRDLNSRSPP